MMKKDQGHSMNERDDVATLVRLAGKRQSVPRERAERVRAAAQAQWQHEVRQRSRTRTIWMSVGLAAAASLILAITIQVLGVGNGVPQGAAGTILVESLVGPVWIRSTGEGGALQSRALGIGDEIPLESALTTDDEGRAAILLASGHSVRLDGSTGIRLLDSASIALDKGTIYVDSGLEARSTPLDIHTPLGLVREIGTQFEINVADDSVRVRLREGAVVVHHGNQTHEVRAGTEFELDPDGSVTRRELSTYGPEWEWIVGITPALDLEGRSARVFLDWVCRERGWTLAFADEAVARSAGEIELGGTVERLTLDEALDAVLPTCRMVYHVVDGVLVIASE